MGSNHSTSLPLSPTWRERGPVEAGCEVERVSDGELPNVRVGLGDERGGALREELALTQAVAVVAHPARHLKVKCRKGRAGGGIYA